MSTRRRSQAPSPHTFDRPLWRTLEETGALLGPEFTPVQGTAAAQTGPSMDEAVTGDAEPVEGRAVDVRAVEGSAPSGFTHFLDGIERSCIVAYVGVIPIVYAYVAAVVRERRDRAFAKLALREEEGFFFPFEHIAPERFAPLGLPQTALFDTKPTGSPVHPVRLADIGREAVKKRRGRLEADVAIEWAEKSRSGWLLIDGGADLAPKVLDTGRVVGLVKSHRTQFIPLDSMRKVLGMGPRARSTVFRPLRPDVGRVYSWYLRLREREHRDLYFGLVRVEARAAPETVELADEISRWLLGEVAPLSLPDPRWDTLLYPIRDCEQYLRARMPTVWPDEL